ncbi:MAG: methylenetetrahydromethanopterin dehydrogenase [Chromatiales bacterium]|nr:methylenetetrahydromethanopterin dehydrogenase [Chromatiales bacterium]
MEKPYILHMLTSAPNLSPFDVNMAMDAGWDAVIPYTALELSDIQALVQDAIFSRGPSGAKRTGLFIGGRDMTLALQMLETAQQAMVPPFEISVMADPSGAFTTAAGMIGAVGDKLKQMHQSDWSDCRVMVLGGTGPVGMVAAILATELGAQVTLMSRQRAKAETIVENCRKLCKQNAEQLQPAGNDEKQTLLAQTQVILATAAAGIQMINADEIGVASTLKVAADVNAVPPSGIHGLDVMDDGQPLSDGQSSAVGIGALAIGNIKYQAQHRLLKEMHQSDKPVYLDYEHACAAAQRYIDEKRA